MLKKAIAALVLLGAASSASAQTDCATPVIRVFQNNQEVPTTGGALTSRATLAVSSAPDCPAQVSYRFKEAQVTLLRGARPVTPTLIARKPEVNLADFVTHARPGDRLYIFVHYDQLLVVAADGKETPYSVPAARKSKGLDLSMDQQRGIAFTWPLTQK
jgi:hypothetical protein